MNPKVDAFLKRQKQWRAEMESLRRVALECGLGEELKWGKPCFTYEKSNVAILQGFKQQCALMFFKGSLLEDPEETLERPGANSHIARRMVFSNVDEVKEKKNQIRDFLLAAIEVEKAGLAVKPQERQEPLPAELEEMFGQVPGLAEAFTNLTPGRQRGYILHFSGAKQARTRRSRIEKCAPRILEGKGLRD